MSIAGEFLKDMSEGKKLTPQRVLVFLQVLPQLYDADIEITDWDGAGSVEIQISKDGAMQSREWMKDREAAKVIVDAYNR